MKNVILLCSLVLLILVFASGCSPEEQENTESQFKPLIMRVTVDEPIHAPPSDAIVNSNILSVSTSLGSQSLSNMVSNNIGQSIIEITGTAVPNTNLFFNVSYSDYWLNAMGETFSDCDNVKMEIIYDGALVYEVTKSFGYNTCPDAIGYNTNFTLQ